MPSQFCAGGIDSGAGTVVDRGVRTLSLAQHEVMKQASSESEDTLLKLGCILLPHHVEPISDVEVGLRPDTSTRSSRSPPEALRNARKKARSASPGAAAMPVQDRGVIAIR